MTKNGEKRYAAAKAAVVEGARKGLVFVVFYNRQTTGRSLKVAIDVKDWWSGKPKRGALALRRTLARLADRVDTETSLGDTYYFQ